MSKVDNLLIGSVGISNGVGQAPTVVLFPNGTVSAVNFSANINSNVSFNAPNANCIFESLNLVATDPAFDPNLDRIQVSFNDGAGANNFTFALASDATLLMQQTGVGSTWELTRGGQLYLNSAGAGVIVNDVNGNPNFTLYAPDQFGAIGLYNSANTGYEWRIQANGNTQLSDSLSVVGNINCQGYVEEAETVVTLSSPLSPVNLSGSFANAQVLINVLGGTAISYNAVLLPVTGRVGQTVKVVLQSPGSGFPLVQTTSPAGFQFRGQGQVFGAGGVNLMNSRAGGLSTQNYVATFTYTNYGGAQDDWLFQVS